MRITTICGIALLALVNITGLNAAQAASTTQISDLIEVVLNHEDSGTEQKENGETWTTAVVAITPEDTVIMSVIETRSGMMHFRIGSKVSIYTERRGHRVSISCQMLIFQDFGADGSVNLSEFMCSGGPEKVQILTNIMDHQKMFNSLVRTVHVAVK